MLEIKESGVFNFVKMSSLSIINEVWLLTFGFSNADACMMCGRGIGDCNKHSFWEVDKQKTDGNGFKRNWKKGISDRINKDGDWFRRKW